MERTAGPGTLLLFCPTQVQAAEDFLKAHYAQAALEVGFADHSHLTRRFKQRIGLTPSQYARIFPKED